MKTEYGGTTVSIIVEFEDIPELQELERQTEKKEPLLASEIDLPYIKPRYKEKHEEKKEVKSRKKREKKDRVLLRRVFKHKDGSVIATYDLYDRGYYIVKTPDEKELHIAKSEVKRRKKEWVIMQITKLGIPYDTAFLIYRMMLADTVVDNKDDIDIIKGMELY